VLYSASYYKNDDAVQPISKVEMLESIRFLGQAEFLSLISNSKHSIIFMSTQRFLFRSGKSICFLSCVRNNYSIPQFLPE